LFALCSLASSFYVSASVTESSHPNVYKEDDVEYFLQTVGKVVIFLLDSDSPITRKNAQMFGDASVVYGEDAAFIAFTMESAPNYFKLYANNNKNLVFLTKEKRGTSTIFPSTESEFSFLLESFLYNDYPQLDDIDQVNGLLRPCRYAILATRPLRPKADDVFFRFLPSVGSIVIMNVSPNLLRAAGCSGHKLAVYRRVDKVVQEFDYDLDEILRFDTDVEERQRNPTWNPYESFQLALKPTFIASMTREFYEHSNTVTGVFITDQMKSEERDMLQRLGAEFPQFLIGGTDVHNSISIFYLVEKALAVPSFVLFNYPAFSYYGYVENATESSIREFLKKCADGTIKPTYPSEEQAPPLKEDAEVSLTKVVGTTYEKFVSDATNDVLMFYLQDPTLQSLEFVRRFAKYMKESKIKGLKIGYINYTVNSSPVGFPELFSEPSVQIFPANDKSANQTFYGGRTVYSLMEFVKRTGTIAVTKNESLFDPDGELYYMNHFLNEVRKLNPESQMQVMGYITDMGIKMKMGRTTEEIIRRLAQIGQEMRAIADAQAMAELQEEQTEEGEQNIFPEDENGNPVESEEPHVVLPPRMRKVPPRV